MFQGKREEGRAEGRDVLRLRPRRRRDRDIAVYPPLLYYFFPLPPAFSQEASVELAFFFFPPSCFLRGDPFAAAFTFSSSLHPTLHKRRGGGG